ncbi:MAG: hypothetical protein IKD06_05355 [Clostridia bacterium]|nr:hypothetical protein [Clostridia bacterium]
MPSSMIHLLAARTFSPREDPLFWVGSVCPDTVEDRCAKDASHFRDRPDRENALRELEARTHRGNSLEEGILLHLFLDWKWDAQAYDLYRKQHGQEDGWFAAYRYQIAMAGSYLYRTNPWGEAVWTAMLQAPYAGQVSACSAAEIRAFLTRNFTWLQENDTGASPFFTPSFVEKFVTHSVEEYRHWRKPETAADAEERNS